MPTPLNEFAIVNYSQHKIYLITPYTSVDTRLNADKCLSVDANMILRYDKCTTEPNQWLEWSMIKLQNSDQHFLLFHHATKGCVKADTLENPVRIEGHCNKSDKSMHWKFVKNVKYPNFLPENLDIFPSEELSYTEVATRIPHAFENMTAKYQDHSDCITLAAVFWISLIGFVAFAVMNTMLVCVLTRSCCVKTNVLSEKIPVSFIQERN